MRRWVAASSILSSLLKRMNIYLDVFIKGGIELFEISRSKHNIKPRLVCPPFFLSSL